MVQLVCCYHGRRVFIVGETRADYSLRLQPQWNWRRCGLGAVHPLEAHMGAVSHSLVLVLLPGAAAECGATLSAGQPRGPRTLTYECRARDADTGAGRAGVATDGPAQCSTFATVAIAGWADCNQWTEEAFVGRRLLDECRARDADTGAGRAGVPPMVPPGAVRSSYCVVERPMPSRHPAVGRCRKPTRTKRLWRRTRSGRSTRSE